MPRGTSDPRRFISLYMPSGTYNIQGDAVWYPPLDGPFSAAASKQFADRPIAVRGQHRRLFGHHASGLQRPRYLPEHQGRGRALVSRNDLAVASDHDGRERVSQCTVAGEARSISSTRTPRRILEDTFSVHSAVAAVRALAPDGNATFNYADYVSFNNGQPNSVIKNPYELFINTFANLGSTTPPPAASTDPATRNRSILDFCDWRRHQGHAVQARQDGQSEARSIFHQRSRPGDTPVRPNREPRPGAVAPPERRRT